MEEIWKPIPGLEGRYEASSKGRIRSLDRVGTYLRNGKPVSAKYRGKILKAQAQTGRGYAEGKGYPKILESA